MPANRARDRAGVPEHARLLDADMHIDLPSVEVLLPYLAAHWREAIELGGSAFFYRPQQMLYPPSFPTSRRPQGGEAPADARERLRRDLLDDWGLERAI